MSHLNWFFAKSDWAAALRYEWLRRMLINPYHAHVLTTVGDSMESAIRSGYLLLVSTFIDSDCVNGI